jgi:hypothetical protein
MKKLLLLVAILAVFASPAFANINSSYLIRQNFTMNANNNLSNYAYPVFGSGVNTSILISEGRLQPNCADLQIANDSNVKQPIEIVNGTCDSTNTEVWTGTNTVSPLFNNSLQYDDSSEVPHDIAEAQNVWDNNFVLVYHFTPGTINDSTHFGNNATFIGAVYNSTGKFGGAYTFNGSDSDTNSIQFPATDNLNPPNNVTLEAWIFINNRTAYPELILMLPYSSTSGNNLGCLLFISGDEPWPMAAGSCTNINDDITFLESTAPIPIDQWVYIAFTYDAFGNNASLYIDGQLNTSSTVADFGENISYGGWHNGSIGWDNQDSRYPFNGSIDEVRVSNIARPASYFTANYNGVSLNSTGLEEIPIPHVSVENPANDTTYNVGTFDLNFTVTSVSPDSCWYILDGANNSLPSCDNTTFDTINGTHILNVYASNSSLGTTGASDTTTFSVDTHNPAVNLYLPEAFDESGTYYNNTNITLYFTAANAIDVDSCWYVLNNVTSSLFPGCHEITFANITSSILANEGLNNITVYANDTANNTGSHSHIFGVDTILPTISIQAPVNNSILVSPKVDINYTASDTNLITCIIDGSYYLGCPNVTYFRSDGTYTNIITAVDLAGNKATTAVTYTVDTTPPVISIAYPAGTIVGNNTMILDLNYTVTDSGTGVNLSTCEYSLDNATPVSLPGCLNSTLNATAGNHTVIVYADDNAGNIGSDSSSFNIGLPSPSPLPGSVILLLSVILILSAIAVVSSIVQIGWGIQPRSADEWISYMVGILIMVTILGILALFILSIS